jgi:hypothetical protein
MEKLVAARPMASVAAIAPVTIQLNRKKRHAASTSSAVAVDGVTMRANSPGGG